MTTWALPKNAEEEEEELKEEEEEEVEEERYGSSQKVFCPTGIRDENEDFELGVLFLIFPC